MLGVIFGLADRSAIAQTDPGRDLFQVHCAGCHGDQGLGDGESSRFIYPRPRDLVNGSYRLRSTPSKTPPTDADILEILKRGLPGSGMPGYTFLADEQLLALVSYLKKISKTYAPDVALPIDLAPEPAVTPALIAAGKKLYTKLECDTCHGEKGRGDGAMSESLVDEKRHPSRPRDLVNEAYKGGTSLREIYYRIVSGMDGTAMPALREGAATSEESWQLAAYVQSLIAPRRKTKGATNKDQDLVTSHRIGGALPADNPLAAGWSKAVATNIPLFPLTQTPSVQPPVLIVRSLYDEKKIGFRLEWPDLTPNDVEASDLVVDAAAVSFLFGGQDTFIGMGAEKTPVRIWHWKARRNTALPFNGGLTLFDRTSPIIEGVASGSGAPTPLPKDLQLTRGASFWERGVWYVVFYRDLATAEDFRRGPSNTKAAFAVWDGAQKERGGQKSVSSWYRLALADEPAVRGTNR